MLFFQSSTNMSDNDIFLITRSPIFLVSSVDLPTGNRMSVFSRPCIFGDLLG